MKLAMAQMRMSEDIGTNLAKSLDFCDQAKGADLLFFPEIQCSPFFPQYEKQNADAYLMQADGAEVQALCAKAKEHSLYLSPNLYLSRGGRRYDCSLWIEPDGTIKDTAEMVHIAQAEQFYERDYYMPSESGFKVFDTPFGTVGIVICFDRHLPESIRTCALMGADLVLIPTANTEAEPMELFEWEIRVQAMQNQVFVAMCNRVGREDQMEFAGQSLVADPRGNLICKADNREQLVTCELDLTEARRVRDAVPYLSTRRKECYL